MFIGLDIHKHFTFCCEMDCQGNVLREFKFPSTPQQITSYANTLGQEDEVALEATTNSLAFAELLKQKAGKVIISNPMQTKAIAWAKIKTDKVDAQVLAQLLRTGFLPEVWQPDKKTQYLRRRTAHREALTRMRTQIKNRIHSILHRNLIEASSFSDLFGTKGRQFLNALQQKLPQDENQQLQMELKLLDTVDCQIKEAEQIIARETVKDEKARLVMSLPGVSHTVAAAIVSAIGPIERFSSSKKLASYFGLNPKVTQSSNHCWTGSISKRGRTLARWLIIEASQVAVRVDGPLKSFYLRIRYKKGHNVAVVAAARKMTCLIWQMLCKDEMYKWAPPLLTQEKLRKLELLAGMPKEKSGPKKRKASEGGRPAYQAKRRVDKSMARIAQVQYEELVNQWKEKNPLKERQRLINQIVAGGDTIKSF